VLRGERSEPRLASLERLLGAGDLLLVTGGLRSLELALELGDGLCQLAGEPLGARDLLRVGAVPVILVELADGRLDLAQAVFDGLDLVAGNLADLLPATLDRGDRVLGLRPVGLGQQRLRLGEQFELGGKVRLELDVVLRVDLRLGRVDRVAGGLELGPQRIVELLAGTTGQLPLVEQRAISGNAVRALGNQRLGLLDELLLLVAGVAVNRVELGEEGLAMRVDRLAGILEALPEIVALRLRVFGRRGPSAWCFCQRAKISSRLALTCFHWAFAGSCAARVSASTTMAVRSAMAAWTAAFDSSVCFSVSSPTVPLRASRRLARDARSPTAFAVEIEEDSDLTAFEMSVAGAPRLARCSRSVT
jgi:hypothetical protein